MSRWIVPFIIFLAIAGVAPPVTAQATKPLLRNAYDHGYLQGTQHGSAYARVRITLGTPEPRRGGWGNTEGHRRRGGYQEPAYARGYSDGFHQGMDDRRGRGRYDPVGHGDYRDGDQGYDRAYGSRDAYRNNYRAGYREGYEDGYRGGSPRGR